MTLADLIADSEDEEFIFHSKGLSLSFDPPPSLLDLIRHSPRVLPATEEHEPTTT